MVERFKKKINGITGAIGHAWEYTRGFTTLTSSNKTNESNESTTYDPNTMERVTINDFYSDNGVYVVETKCSKGLSSFRQKIICLVTVLSIAILCVAVNLQIKKSSPSEKKVAQGLQDDDIDDDEIDKIPLAPSDLSEMCAMKNIQTQDGFSDCEEECIIASCCVMAKTMESFCFTESNFNPCLTYKSCESIHPIFGLLEVPRTSFQSEGKANSLVPSEHVIAETCSKKGLETPEGKKMCEELCEPSQCCFATESDNCRSQKSDLCFIYSPCTVISYENKDDVYEDEGDEDGDLSTQAVAYAPSEKQVVLAPKMGYCGLSYDPEKSTCDRMCEFDSDCDGLEEICLSTLVNKCR
mmetsp:Transcript_38237/g.44533  ORF Transcript_38237/g.44533 Transcript_38237/m.44533 type:complete len:354 (+) Transcript_38237:39-1100(+)